MTRDQRLRIVNKIIAEIANRGRGFFKHGDKTASFFTINTTLYYEHAHVSNGVTYSRVDSSGYFKNEHHGGTLKALLKEFSAFIRTGKDTDGSEGRGGLWCGHWGYSQEDMKAIQDFAIELGYTSALPKED